MKVVYIMKKLKILLGISFTIFVFLGHSSSVEAHHSLLPLINLEDTDTVINKAKQIINEGKGDVNHRLQHTDFYYPYESLTIGDKYVYLSEPTILILAVLEGRVNMVKLLIERGAIVNNEKIQVDFREIQSVEGNRMDVLLEVKYLTIVEIASYFSEAPHLSQEEKEKRKDIYITLLTGNLRYNPTDLEPAPLRQAP